MEEGMFVLRPQTLFVGRKKAGGIQVGKYRWEESIKYTYKAITKRRKM